MIDLAELPQLAHVRKGQAREREEARLPEGREPRAVHEDEHAAQQGPQHGKEESVTARAHRGTSCASRSRVASTRAKAWAPHYLDGYTLSNHANRAQGRIHR